MELLHHNFSSMQVFFCGYLMHFSQNDTLSEIISPCVDNRHLGNNIASPFFFLTARACSSARYFVCLATVLPINCFFHTNIPWGSTCPFPHLLHTYVTDGTSDLPLSFPGSIHLILLTAFASEYYQRVPWKS